MEVSEDFAAKFNLCEGSLWLVIAAIITWRLLSRTRAAKMYWVLPPTFVVFGVSDFIESRTGAFWDPWWLLVIKTACVLVFALVGIRHRQDRLRLNAHTHRSGKHPGA